jgi:hypothetical protein
VRKFICRILFFIVFVFLLLEVTCRILIDPLYFGKLDIFNLERKHVFDSYFASETKHVDYLFIGSSRVAASINPHIFMSMDSNSIAVNTGRGYYTSAIHYQALKKRIAKYPDFIRGSKVLIELPGSSIFTESFKDNQYRVWEPIVKTDKPMPHLLLPYLNRRDFMDFFLLSPNGISVKMDMTLLFFFSSYRCAPFIKEMLKSHITFSLNNQNEDSIASEGGIRNDLISLAKQKAIDIAKIDIENQEITPPLFEQSIDRGFIAYFNNLITSNGGKLYLFEMPMHSIQKKVFNTEKEKNNFTVFNTWAKKHDIKILRNNKFEYSDSDFPDYWHLGKNRRDEFSFLLFNEIKESEEPH